MKRSQSGGSLLFSSPHFQHTRLLEGKTCHSTMLLFPKTFSHSLQGMNLWDVMYSLSQEAIRISTSDDGQAELKLNSSSNHWQALLLPSSSSSREIRAKTRNTGSMRRGRSEDSSFPDLLYALGCLPGAPLWIGSVLWVAVSKGYCGGCDHRPVGVWGNGHLIPHSGWELPSPGPSSEKCLFPGRENSLYSGQHILFSENYTFLVSSVWPVLNFTPLKFLLLLV